MQFHKTKEEEERNEITKTILLIVSILALFKSPIKSDKRSPLLLPHFFRSLNSFLNRIEYLPLRDSIPFLWRKESIFVVSWVHKFLRRNRQDREDPTFPCLTTGERGPPLHLDALPRFETSIPSKADVSWYPQLFDDNSTSAFERGKSESLRKAKRVRSFWGRWHGCTA